LRSIVTPRPAVRCRRLTPKSRWFPEWLVRGLALAFLHGGRVASTRSGYGGLGRIALACVAAAACGHSSNQPTSMPPRTHALAAGARGPAVPPPYGGVEPALPTDESPPSPPTPTPTNPIPEPPRTEPVAPAAAPEPHSSRGRHLVRRVREPPAPAVAATWPLPRGARRRTGARSPS
jgi:hypothetical protein